MSNKLYNVVITLPDLAAAHAEQEARVETSSWPMAIKLACDEISRRPHVKGKRIKSARIDFSVVENRRDAASGVRPYFMSSEDGASVQGALFEL
jgi:hypothetical protein